MDSTRKEARNRQWDKVIGETRAEVEAAGLDQERRLASLDGAQEQPEQERTIPPEGPVRFIKFPRVKWSNVLNWAAAQEVERTAAGFQDCRGVPLELLQNLSESDLLHLLSDERLLRKFYGGCDSTSLVADAPSMALSKKKLRTMEWSVLKLVLRLLLHSSEGNHAHEPQPTADTVSRLLSGKRVQLQEMIRDADGHLIRLFSKEQHPDLYESFPSPDAPRYDYNIQTHEGILTRSNDALQAILGGFNASSTGKVSNICAHLLLLGIAPDIHTYNLLLVHFCQLREDALVHAVLDSMRESHVRPNEITHATILRFFTVSNDGEGFGLYLKRMNGHGQGLALAHPERQIHPLVKSRYHRFGTNKRKIAEKARMNAEVYSSIIVGLLKLFRREEAMCYYRKMISEGWRPTMEVLTALLQDCYELADLKSGRKVWEIIQNLREKGIRVGKTAYEYMLALCERCEQRPLYDQILSDRTQNDALPWRTSDAPNQIVPCETDNAPIRPTEGPGATSLGPSLPRLRSKYRNIPARLISELLWQVHSDDELEEKLRALDQSHRRQRELRVLTKKFEVVYDNLTEDMVRCTQETCQLLQLRDRRILRYAATAKVTASERQLDSKVVQHAYNGFRKMTEREIMMWSTEARSWAQPSHQATGLPPPCMGGQQQSTTATSA